MENALSITIQDLLEIDSGRGIHFTIANWANEGIHIRMNIGWHYYVHIVRKYEIDSNFDFKAFILDELRFHADELYEKHLEDERKKKEGLYEC